MSNHLGSIRRSDRERIAVLELDQPDRQLNVVDEALLAELRQRVEEILADPSVDAYVLTSGKRGSFGAGADVSWLPELAVREDAEEFLRGVHELMLKIARAPKPMITALNGSAFGGALELALASYRIVAVESAQLGLPEATLGLLPGGGGTQLLNRFVDPATAAELLTSGRRLTAAEAREVGLLHDVVPDEALLDTAVRTARAAVGQRATEPTHGADATQAISERRQALQNSREGLSRAAAEILDVLEVGTREGVEAGLRAERGAFLRLLKSPEARAAIHLFLVRSEVNRRSRGDGSKIEQVAVVGGGQMGAGIAATAVTRGLRAVVRDVDDAALARARGYLEKVLARGGAATDDQSSNWQGTTAWADFAGADVVIEAVFELPDLKKDVLGKVSDVVSETTLLATNTSAIPIRELATAVSRPERFLGMHFFSPVERMPLVELIAHSGTASDTLQRAASVGRQLGKVPIVVGDAPGFFTSRVYARWLLEGIRLLLDGAAPQDVDAGAKAVGFPVGPLQAHDEATLQLVLDASVTQVAEPVFHDRLDVGAVRQVLETLVANGIQGRRQGAGFYRYDERGKRVGLNEEITALVPSATGAIDREVVGERLLLAFATECFLCWDEGILCHPDDGDIAAVLGIGFPRALGGPFHWADETGTAEVRARCEKFGDAFPAGAMLTRLAAEGSTFSAQPRRAVPFEELPA